MALRDQPYLPLYIQDYLTDEKLNECLPGTQGIYVKIMCLMHKSKHYGKILLKQKYKQTESINLNFAKQLVKHLTFTEVEISQAIKELLDEEVCFVDGDYLCQKRMIKDNELSIKRANAGQKGGKKTHEFAKAKNKANTEYENENENENENEDTKLKIKNENASDSLMIYTREEMKSFLESDSGLRQKCESDLKLNYESRKEYIEKFLVHLADYRKTRFDAKEHFWNWLKKQPKIDEKQKKPKKEKYYIIRSGTETDTIHHRSYEVNERKLVEAGKCELVEIVYK